MVVEKGYKQTEVGVIPEDWEIKDLFEIVTFLDGQRKPIKSNERIPGDYPYYGASGIIDYVCDYIFDEELILLGEDGENIISRNLPLAFQVKGKIWVNNHAHVLKPKEEVNITFLTEFLESLDYKLLNSGTAQPKLNKQACYTIKIVLPPLPEQTAIANALSDMDALIAQTERLIEKKKAIKQGVMQELLKPKEGWVTKKLGDLVDKVTTGKLDANAMKPDGEYRFYTCAKEYYFIDRYSFDHEALLISGNGANVGYIHYYKGKFNAYQRTYVLIGFQIDVSFLKIYLDKHLADRITTEVSAGNTPYIKMDTITEMVVQYPPVSNEQSAISNQINDINKEIELINTKLQKLKHQKQGMMQALLTGKIRLI